VRKALQSIFKHNYRKDFSGHQQFPRAYVKDDEAGLLNCTWPLGGKPETPLLYSDEVWTGIEYEVAGALLFEGMIEEALEILAAVRKRHDGRLRSPWNEVECGDHYVRAMSSWELLEATAGYEHNASKGLLSFAPRISRENFSCFFATATGWGRYSQRLQARKLTAKLAVYGGEAKVRELRLSHSNARKATVMIGSRKVPLSFTHRRGCLSIRFKEMQTTGKDQTLRVSVE
jgi:hypothetical protein